MTTDRAGAPAEPGEQLGRAIGSDGTSPRGQRYAQGRYILASLKESLDAGCVCAFARPENPVANEAALIRGHFLLATGQSRQLEGCTLALDLTKQAAGDGTLVTITFGNPPTDGRTPAEQEHRDFDSIAALPVLRGDERAGVVCCCTSNRLLAPSRAEQALMVALIENLEPTAGSPAAEVKRMLASWDGSGRWLFDALDTGVVAVSTSGCIEILNSAARSLLAMDVGDVLVAPFASRELTIFPFSDGQGRPDPVTLEMRIHRPRPRVRIEIRGADGNPMQTDVSARPVYGDDSDLPVAAVLFFKAADAVSGTAREMVERVARLENAFEHLATVLHATPARAAPPAPRFSQFDEILSQREREVLALIADGLRVTNIADELYLSAHTVRNHLKSIFRKLGVSSQAELVRKLREDVPSGD